MHKFISKEEGGGRRKTKKYRTIDDHATKGGWSVAAHLQGKELRPGLLVCQKPACCLARRAKQVAVAGNTNAQAYFILFYTS